MSFERGLVGNIHNRMSTGLRDTCQPANIFKKNLLDIELYGNHSLQNLPGEQNHICHMA